METVSDSLVEQKSINDNLTKQLDSANTSANELQKQVYLFFSTKIFFFSHFFRQIKIQIYFLVRISRAHHATA